MTGGWCGPTASLIAECLKTHLPKDSNYEDFDDQCLGIDELRSTDPLLTKRQLWQYEGTEGNGGWLLRFGSFPERALHNGMRMLALVELFFMPFVAAFDAVYPLRSSPTVICLDALFSLCYATGVLLRLRTTFVHSRDATECTDGREIQRYVCRKADFRADCVALLCSPALYFGGPLWLLGILRLLKCWRLPHNPKRLILLNSTHSMHGFDIAEQFLEIITAVLAAMHIYGCVWFMAKAASPPNYGHEWSAWNGWSRDVFTPEQADAGSLSVPIEPGDLSDLGWCYIRALRDGAYMLVGWSGPNALSTVELFTVCFLGPSGACIMACVYGFVVATISQARILESRFLERADILNKACRSMHLPPGLRARINHYHSYMEVLCLGTDAQSLFAQLSPNLTCEMRMFRMRGVLRSASIFQGLEPRVSLMLAQTCIEQVFAPGDMVVRKGEVGDCMYIILKGSVAVLPDDGATKIVMRLGEAECFGELCLLRDRMQRTAWIRAQTFCVLWRLDKDRVDALLGGRRDLQQKVYSRIVAKVGRFVDADDLKTYLADLNIRSRSLAPDQHFHFDSENVSFPGDKPLSEEDEESRVGRLSDSQNRRQSNVTQCTEVYYTHNGVETDESTPLMSDRDDEERNDPEVSARGALIVPRPPAPAVRGSGGALPAPLPPPRARLDRRVSMTESLTGGLVEGLRGSSFPHLYGESRAPQFGRRHSIGLLPDPPDSGIGLGHSHPPAETDSGKGLQAQLAELSSRLESVQILIAKSVLPRLSRIEGALPSSKPGQEAHSGPNARGESRGASAGDIAAPDVYLSCH